MSQNLFLFLITCIKQQQNSVSTKVLCGLVSVTLFHQLYNINEDEDKKELKLLILHFNNS